MGGFYFVWFLNYNQNFNGKIGFLPKQSNKSNSTNLKMQIKLEFRIMWKNAKPSKRFAAKSLESIKKLHFEKNAVKYANADDDILCWITSDYAHKIYWSACFTVFVFAAAFQTFPKSSPSLTLKKNQFLIENDYFYFSRPLRTLTKQGLKTEKGNWIILSLQKILEMF